MIRRYLLSHFQDYHRLEKLNCRVRDGNGCFLLDMVAGRSVGGRSGPAALGGCFHRWLAASLALPARRATIAQRAGGSERTALHDANGSVASKTRESFGYKWPSIRPLVPVS